MRTKEEAAVLLLRNGWNQQEINQVLQCQTLLVRTDYRPPSKPIPPLKLETTKFPQAGSISFVIEKK